VTRSEAEALLANPDLIAAGMKGEEARTAISGDRITYGRVLSVVASPINSDIGGAGEVRVMRPLASIDAAAKDVREVAARIEKVPVTGFSLGDLLDLAGNDHLALADYAKQLRDAGLEAVAEAPLDRLGDTENAIEVFRAVMHGGLGVWRATIERAPMAARLDFIETAVAIQRETQALRAFAPLPRQDPADAPSTGYDDVRTIAIARVMCPESVAIQVDWPLYGPKLAQVAIAYGASDIDGVAAADDMTLGHRRSPVEDIERQIRAAGGRPAARNGRYELLT
jgi:aminodeoxyfutalosine synthase